MFETIIYFGQNLEAKTFFHIICLLKIMTNKLKKINCTKSLTLTMNSKVFSSWTLSTLVVLGFTQYGSSCLWKWDDGVEELSASILFCVQPKLCSGKVHTRVQNQSASSWIEDLGISKSIGSYVLVSDQSQTCSSLCHESCSTTRPPLYWDSPSTAVPAF